MTNTHIEWTNTPDTLPNDGVYLISSKVITKVVQIRNKTPFINYLYKSEWPTIQELFPYMAELTNFVEDNS